MQSDNLLAPEIIRDPYPYFSRLRETDPVFWNDRLRAWIVTSYPAVDQGLRSPALSSDRILRAHAKATDPRLKSALLMLSRWLVFTDPPAHGRLRRLILKSFTSQAVGRMKERISGIVDELLDGCGKDAFDVVDRVAYPLPAIVIAELLGAPAEDRDMFRSWSDHISVLVFGSDEGEEAKAAASSAMLAFVDYFSDLVGRYEREPADNLLSSLIHARDANEALSHDEVIATAILVLFAGHETTTNLIANGMYHLLRTPDQHALLLARPELIETAVEEFLRFDGPSKMAVRYANSELELGGKAIQPGERVLLVQAGANRDPSVFADPDQLRIDRSPNPHLGFGKGIHFCVGAPLARLESQIAIAKLVERHPRMRLVHDELEWEPVLLNRGPLALHVNP